MGIQYSGFYREMLAFYLPFTIILLLSNVHGHKRGSEPIAAFDSYMPTGTLCNKQLPITSWIRIFDRYRDASNSRNDDVNFVNGVYTTPARGIYHCCASARCKDGGVCDFTIIRNAGNGDVVYGAFGTRNPLQGNNGFSSHGLCITSKCQAGVKWKVNFESGGNTDCIEETGWRYGKFSCFLASDT